MLENIKGSGMFMTEVDGEHEVEEENERLDKNED